MAETYYNRLQVKMKAQEIAKRRASYRRPLVVALGQLKRMPAATASLPAGPLCFEQEVAIATAKSGTSKARPRSLRTWPPRRCSLVCKDTSKFNKVLRFIQDSTAYAAPP